MTVSISHLMPFILGTGGVVITYNLYLTSTYSMSHAKRSKPTIARRPFSDAKPFVVCSSCLIEADTPVNHGHVPVCMHRFANVLHTHAYVKWKTRIR